MSTVVVLAMLGMLSPASRGALMTAGIFVFMFMGFVDMHSVLAFFYVFSHTRFSWCTCIF